MLPISCLSFAIIRFSRREMYDCEIPSISATSFCVFSLPFERPKRSVIMSLSLSFNSFIALLTIFLSSSDSRSLYTESPSLPRMSDKSNSFPSQSTFMGSSIDISHYWLLHFLMYISISFSIQREA